MKIKQHFATDASAEEEGVWVEIGEGAAVKVARFGNKRHEKALDRLRKPYRNILRTGGEIPKDRAEAIVIESMAEALLLDWRGFEDDDGRAIAHDKETAIGLLTELKDFRNQVAAIAMEAETYRASALEAAAKNSKSGSRGRSASEARPASS